MAGFTFIKRLSTGYQAFANMCVYKYMCIGVCMSECVRLCVSLCVSDCECVGMYVHM